MNKLVLMKGYVLSKLKYSVNELQCELINSNKILLSMDNRGNYKSSGKDIEYALFNSDYLNKYDADINQVIYNYYLMWLYPIEIKYKSIKLKVNILLKMYTNNTVITSLIIESKSDIKKIQSLIYNSEFDVSCDNELYMELFRKYNINNMYSLFEFVKLLMSDYFVMSGDINRNLFVCDKEYLDIKDIYKIMYFCDKEFKEYKPLNDFRCFDDYYHYSDEGVSIIYGRDTFESFYRVLSLDYHIIYLILNDFVIYSNIRNNKYSIFELYKLRDNLSYNFVTRKYSKYVCENNYINYVLDLENRFSISELVNSSINKKIELINFCFQILLTIIGILITIISLTK